ncbi:unnamed protein product [Lactuca saligna]|uniref:Arabidopsis retrotransposon Orf1 C-terminal domain-containing protein n=1 Tax=Lactuca saligna TaxID=75948 RepID=A0AA35ZQM1_LACSI|nr:unnamed protein product [Lactuca saligna]
MEAASSKRPRQTKSSARRRKPRTPSPPSRSPSPPPTSPTPPADPSHCGVIWWHGLLRVHELSYKVPIDEFLSSVYLDHGILSFRLMNQYYEISLDEINAIVGARTENTFGPTDPIQGYFDLTWWTQLTQLHPYVSSAAKASSLIHPVMKVGHRIIASLVAPREERSTINALELKILYAMTHLENNLIPHYGRFLCHKLIRLNTSRLGKIVCGGIVSMLAKSAQIRAPYPSPH